MENNVGLPNYSSEELAVVLENHRLSEIELLSLDKYLAFEIVAPSSFTQSETTGSFGDPQEESDISLPQQPAVVTSPSGRLSYPVGTTPGEWGGYKNGKIPVSAMTSVAKRGDKWYGGLHFLRPDAADAWLKMRARAKSEGIALTVTSAYRSVEHQASIPGKRKARPGHSNHGSGLAVDIHELYFSSQGQTKDIQQAARMRESKIYKWLDRVGPEFGWFNPVKMKDGVGLEEPWHWEYYGPPKK